MAEHPVVKWLEAELARVEAAARTATPGPWEATEHAEYGFRVGTADGASWVAWTGAHDDEPESSRPDSLFIAANSPAAALRRVAADRQILEWHQPEPGVGFDDNAGKCIKMTACTNCGTSDEYGIPWPCRTVLLLAEAYGWTEDTP